MRRKTITPEMRRHCDYLRRKAMAVAKVYGARLRRCRHKAVRDTLEKCRDIDPSEWAGLIDTSFSEPYIYDIITGLYNATGLPQARSTVRDMNASKADESNVLENLWLASINAYARQRAGELIVSVTGTVKDTLRRILADEMSNDSWGVEKLVQRIMKRYSEQEEWEVRRIAQTETMFSLGKASQIAADSLDVDYIKQWACSGLSNTRESHLAMDGVIVGKDDYFLVNGSHLLYPHDTSLDPAASEVINCACTCIRLPN